MSAADPVTSTPMPDVVTVDETNATAANATVFMFHESLLAYSGLYTMALFCIIVGSHRSVAFVRTHIQEKRKIESSVLEKEAKWFPVTASAVLFSLYLFFKHGEHLGEYLNVALVYLKLRNETVAAATDSVVDVVNSTSAQNVTLTGLAALKQYMPAINKQNLMFLLLLLICLEGCQALAHLLKPLVSRLISYLPISETNELKQNLKYHLNFNKSKSKGSHEQVSLINWEFDTHDIVSLVCFLPVGVAHVLFRHWITNDMIGMAFSLFAIEMLHLCSFKAGCFMLSGLFVYDVFWVFGTDVMTTVATNINAPILLQFPQDMLRNGPLLATKHSMLGLGDIVIPGIFLALLLRFDRGVSNGGEPKKKRYYFWSTVVAYAAGLVLTIFVMHYFKAAQPALLYLVPLCVGTPCVLAMIQGEFTELFNFTERHLVKDDEEKEKTQ